MENKSFFDQHAKPFVSLEPVGSWALLYNAETNVAAGIVKIYEYTKTNQTTFIAPTKQECLDKLEELNLFKTKFYIEEKEENATQEA